MEKDVKSLAAMFEKKATTVTEKKVVSSVTAPAPSKDVKNLAAMFDKKPSES